MLFILIDINECVDDFDGCQDGCENTIGSFFCTCPTFGPGYRANGTTCVGMYSRFIGGLIALRIMIFQISMNVLKVFITVPVKIIETATTLLETLNVFVMMVMKRTVVGFV